MPPGSVGIDELASIALRMGDDGLLKPESTQQRNFLSSRSNSAFACSTS